MFDGCERLGAVNLRGTRFASRDFEVHEFRAKVGADLHTVEINVTGLAGFLLAKAGAAFARHRPKDWYDIAFVLIQNDAGGPEQAASVVLDRFRDEISGSTRSAVKDLRANFTEPSDQGPSAYVQQMRLDQPDIYPATAAADAVAAVERFCDTVLE